MRREAEEEEKEEEEEEEEEVYTGRVQIWSEEQNLGQFAAKLQLLNKQINSRIFVKESKTFV